MRKLTRTEETEEERVESVRQLFGSRVRRHRDERACGLQQRLQATNAELQTLGLGAKPISLGLHPPRRHGHRMGESLGATT